MGKFFIDEKDLVRVKLPDGQWIDHKTELSQSDSDYIMSKMVSTRAVVDNAQPDNKDKVNSEIEIKLGKLPLLERSIVAWSFDEPLNSENINSLRPEIREKVLNSIEKQNKKPSEFLKN